MPQNTDDYEAWNYDAAPPLGPQRTRPHGAWSQPYQAGYVPSPSIRADPMLSASSSQRLLDKTDADDAQYATYRSNINEEGAEKRVIKLTKGWVPVPLRAWFWIPLVTIMILLAIGLEIALLYSNQNSGWSTFSVMTADSAFANYYHYAYTQFPVILSMIIAALWGKHRDSKNAALY